MDGLHVFVVALLGFSSGSQDWISGTEVMVTPGDNITLYCDCKASTGVYIVWFRNCSHENQPTLAVKTRPTSQGYKKFYSTFPPRFEVVKNFSSKTYDLLISNVTESDEGLYYCGTEHMEVEEKEHITPKYSYRYGNVTRIVLDSRESHPQECDSCWTLLFSLCPLCSGVSSLFSALLVYCLCRKRDFQGHQQTPDTGPTRFNQDEDVCYAALDIRQPSQRPKRKTQSSDFSTYSAINTSRM